MMMKTRREFIKQSANLISVVAATPLFNIIAWAEDCPTPSATAGPFYKQGAPFRNLLREQSHKGIPLIVSGKVTDVGGKAIKDAVVEIWHTDPSGDYDMDGYLYRASIRASSDGQYAFETFLPGNYGGRAQHIHYKISTPSNRSLITQLYFDSDPFFQGNPENTFERDPIISDVSLVRPVSGDSKSGLKVDFPICLKNS
jgi:protocatechuate 3,4-dioxygenase beta subunit